MKLASSSHRCRSAGPRWPRRSSSIWRRSPAGPIPTIEIELISASADPDAFDTLECDLAAISILTPTAVPGYRIAEKLRARGIKVVFGSMHASAMPEEAKHHGDAVVIGEAESVWPEVLRDFRAGQLKPFYRGEQIALDDLPTPLYGLLQGKRKHQFRIVNTSRGCPYNCTFCSVKAVLRRARSASGPLTTWCAMWPPSRKRCISTATRTSGGQARSSGPSTCSRRSRGAARSGWGSAASRPVLSPAGSRMLNAARESGMLTVWVGWDAISDEGLKAYAADGKIGVDRERAVRTLRDHGIDVSLFYMLGSRARTPWMISSVPWSLRTGWA